MLRIENRRRKWVIALGVVLVLTVSAMGQSISPPIAEYRGKAQGMMELRNDGDRPLAAILEVHGFGVDENGTLKYAELDRAVKVDLGASSFIVGPHQSHYVFYKATSESSSFWFAILATLTEATPVKNQIRINIVLPHVVYVYQKSKIKQSEVVMRTVPSQAQGEYRLEITNLSQKLGRVQAIESHGFAHEVALGGVPVFPKQKRYIAIRPGTLKNGATLKVTFEDGFTTSIPVL
jgi:hypothetical protein